MNRSRHTLAALAASVGLAALATSTFADSGRAMPRIVPPAYIQECASCHTAYPPSMLPAASWRRVMSSLDRHYGSDASIEPAAAQQIGQWLNAHAGTYKRVAEEPPQDRITRSAWFGRKHRKVEPAVWQLPSVKSAASCSACHTGADRGDYDDAGLRMPEGLSARQRWAWRD